MSFFLLSLKKRTKYFIRCSMKSSTTFKVKLVVIVHFSFSKSQDSGQSLAATSKIGGTELCLF
jgi:hypothetical protein